MNIRGFRQDDFSGPFQPGNIMTLFKFHILEYKMAISISVRLLWVKGFSYLNSCLVTQPGLGVTIQIMKFFTYWDFFNDFLGSFCLMYVSNFCVNEHTVS